MPLPFTIYDFIDLSSVVESAERMEVDQPTYSFSIPSLFDGLEVDCRIYHPLPGEDTNEDGLKAAIVGHPYAPLGGSYDDGVVSIVGRALAKAGYIVGTINFRGATGSMGKTSWTGTPELTDFVSLYGFMISYMAHLTMYHKQPESIQLYGQSTFSTMPPDTAAISENVQRARGRSPNCRFVCAGYSYGSIIARHCPTPDVVIDIFSTNPRDSMKEEIHLRAAHLAQLHIRRVASQLQDRPSSGYSVALGGQESQSSNRRTSRDGYRHSVDLESFRRSLNTFKERRLARIKENQNEGTREPRQNTQFPLFGYLPTFEASYLLISPPLSVTAAFLTMLCRPRLESKIGSIDQTGSLDSQSVEDRLSHHASMAIWGVDDSLQPSRQVRKWAQQLSARPESKFVGKEIPSAGHFWREDGAVRRLKQGITEWLEYLEP